MVPAKIDAPSSSPKIRVKKYATIEIKVIHMELRTPIKTTLSRISGKVVLADNEMKIPNAIIASIIISATILLSLPNREISFKRLRSCNMCPNGWDTTKRLILKRFLRITETHMYLHLQTQLHCQNLFPLYTE